MLECLRALDKHGDQDTARRYLYAAFNYTELDTLCPEEREMVERLMEDLPFDCPVEQCKHAIRISGGDLDDALAYLENRKVFFFSYTARLARSLGTTHRFPELSK